MMSLRGHRLQLLPPETVAGDARLPGVIAQALDSLTEGGAWDRVEGGGARRRRLLILGGNVWWPSVLRIQFVLSLAGVTVLVVI
jgi:hypothetical protein